MQYNNKEEEFMEYVFVPFLGDFLSIRTGTGGKQNGLHVFVPFLGDFLSMLVCLVCLYNQGVFVPFLGDFLSIRCKPYIEYNVVAVFVPFLGDFLSMKRLENHKYAKCGLFSSPFLGTFFQSRACEAPARLLSQAHSRRG